MKKNYRPKLKIELSDSDRKIEIISYIFLISMWVISYYYYSILPDTIPLKFDMDGKIINYGSKLTIFLIPTIITFTFILLTIINNFPHTFNYIVEITPENAYFQYSQAVKLVRAVRLSTILVAILIIYQIKSSALDENFIHNLLFIFLLLAIVFIPIIYYFIKISSANKS